MQVTEAFGKLDVLINNAGVIGRGPNLRARLDDALRANASGPAATTDAFRSLLLKSKRSYLLNVSSTLGSLANASDPNSLDYQLPATAYRMSKAALNMLTVQTHKEIGQQGVKVFAVCPGLVRSNLRGGDEAAVSAGGRAVDAEVSGQLFLSIIEGKRDVDVGKFVHKDGVYSW
jgi:NAD(P)-dependent dehydrogenase (short-subunit alcohol dehydrogenase family)